MNACADVTQILRHVAAGEGLGVIAWENNVEGYVVPNLDMMIDATDVAAFMRVGVDVTFDAFVTAATAQHAQDRDHIDARLHACADVPQILRHVAAGEGLGVIAWENNVEGYVVPNLDMMIDATDVAAFMRVGVDVTFDAFVTAATAQHAQDRDHILESCSVVTAHPHGLAQCRAFADRYGLRAVPASSNAAACRDLREGEVGLGPSICGELYGLDRVATHVEDFAGARTEFLVAWPRTSRTSPVPAPNSSSSRPAPACNSCSPTHGSAVCANSNRSSRSFRSPPARACSPICSTWCVTRDST